MSRTLSRAELISENANLKRRAARLESALRRAMQRFYDEGRFHATQQQRLEQQRNRGVNANA